MSITSPFRACIVAGLAALTMLLAIPLSAHAATDMQLKFGASQPGQPAITGESIDKSLPGAIAVNSFDWSVEAPVTIGSSSSGPGAGKAKLTPLEIEKNVDASSPALMTAAGSRSMYKDVWLLVRNAGAAGSAPYLQYHLSTVFVTNIQTSADSGDDTVTEKVTLAYGAIQQRYVPAPSKTGAPVNPVVSGWDQMVNSVIPADWMPAS